MSKDEAERIALAGMGIAVTHDDLIRSIGPEAARKISEAGFVLVPVTWRELAFRVMGAVSEAERERIEGEIRQ